MPLFFFISGMTLFYSMERKIKFKEFFMKKVKSIIVPYLIFSFITFLYWFFIERKTRNQYNDSVLYSFLNIFLARVEEYPFNVVMWFLPCLFVSKIIIYWILKIQNKAIQIISVVFGFLIGYIIATKNIILPFTIETALISQIYIYLGFLYQKYTSSNDKFKKVDIPIFIISTLLIYICYKKDYALDMLSHSYGKIYFFLIATFSGILITLVVSKLLNKIDKKKWLSYVGKNSLIIMCVHEPIKRIVIVLYSKIFNIQQSIARESLLHSLIITFLVLLIILPIIFIINKYLPFIIGKKKIKEESTL